MKLRNISILLLSATALCSNAQSSFDGNWKGQLNAGLQKLTLTLSVSTSDYVPSVTIGCVEQGFDGLAGEVKKLDNDSIIVDFSKLKANYTGKIGGDSIHGTFTQMGFPFKVDLQRAGTLYSRPQEPKAPFPYTCKDVAWDNGNAHLEGTLTYPVGYSKGKSKVTPIVVMVNGSGQQDRDEEIFHHKPFLVIADYLARNGIASLRYDDRQTGKSKGDTDSLTTLDNLADALGGVDYVKHLGEFGKVGMLGHSEGGMIAFMAAAQQKVDFIVSMAGPGIKGDSLIAEQIRRSIELSPVPLSKDLVQKAIEQNRNEAGPWMKYFLQYDPAENLRRTKCPTMAINGSKDSQVIPESNLEAIKRLVPQNSKNLFKLYPDLNHLFQHCKTGSVTEYLNIEETISTEVLTDIANWIKSL